MTLCHFPPERRGLGKKLKHNTRLWWSTLCYELAYVPDSHIIHEFKSIYILRRFCSMTSINPAVQEPKLVPDLPLRLTPTIKKYVVSSPFWREAERNIACEPGRRWLKSSIIGENNISLKSQLWTNIWNEKETP